MVKLEVKRIGSTRRCVLEVDPCMEVSALRDIVAKELNVEEGRLKLVLRGNPLQLSSDVVRISAGDCLLVVTAPKAPPLHVQNGYSEDEVENDLSFRLPDSVSPAQRRIVKFLRQTLGVPEIVLVIVYSIGLRRWLLFFAWFPLAQLAYRWEVGPLYVIVSILGVIFFNLGKRQEGELSAYSIFNEGFRELPGTLNAERLDTDLRAGRL